MTPLSHHSPVRFMDDESMAKLMKASGRQHGNTENQAIVSTMFNSTKLQILTKLCGQEAVCPPEEKLSREDLYKELTTRFVAVIHLLISALDLRSKEWKNAPGIWELLSFDAEVLNDADTPLPDALREAVNQTQHLFHTAIDPEELMQDLDDVIHQTYGRRLAIERVATAAMNRDISETPLLFSSRIPESIARTAHMHIMDQLGFADAVIADSAATAICRACDEEKGNEDPASFSLDASEVTRVTGEQALISQVGDVYLVRSQNVSSLGDHYIVIIGGLIQKPHGLRPEDIAYAIPDGQQTPLDAFPPEEALVLLKLDDHARVRFYDAYGVEDRYRRY